MILGIFPFITLTITAKLIDAVVDLVQKNNGQYMTVLTYILIQFGITVLSSFLRNINQHLDSKVRVDIEYQVGLLVSEKSLRSPLEYFEIPAFYNHFERIYMNHSRLLSPIQSLMEIVQSFVSLLSYLFFLLAVHWSLASVSLISAIPIIIIQSKYGNRKFFLMKFQTPAARESNFVKALLYDKQSAKEIRIFQLGKLFYQKME